MDRIEPVGPRIYEIPSVERVGHRVDPEQQKREQQKRDGQRRRERDGEPAEPEEDDGLPHIDISV
jgi:hypothetical protein